VTDLGGGNYKISGEAPIRGKSLGAYQSKELSYKAAEHDAIRKLTQYLGHPDLNVQQRQVLHRDLDSGKATITLQVHVTD
jgi:hypothetical protein